METSNRHGRVEWRLDERHFSGSPMEVAGEIDELVVALLALRRTLVDEAGARRANASGPARIWTRVWSLFGLLGLLLAFPSGLAAQSGAPVPVAPKEPWRAVTFGVSLEGFYEYNANEPDDRVNTLRAYDARAGSFGIQQLSSVIELAPAPGEGRRVGLRVDVQFGQATEAVQGNPANEPRPSVYRNVWQAFGSYVIPAGRGLQVDVGKFASNLGYESNYAKDNQAFSRSFLFNFLPFYHMGLRATLPVTDRITVMGCLTNGVQQTEDFNDFKSGQLSATVKPHSRVAWTLNYYAGREQSDGGLPGGPDGVFQSLDTYVSGVVSERVTIALDLNHTRNEVDAGGPALSVAGLGAYVRARLASSIAVGARYERLDDEGLFSGVKQVLQEVTLTLEHQAADGFLLRAEYRHDWSDVAYFPSGGSLLARQPTFLIGAVWWMGTKAGSW